MNGDLSTSCNLSNCDCDKPKPMPDQRARELWKAITDEMFLAKRSGMTPRELAVFTDRRAVEILLTALADERRRGFRNALEKVAQDFADNLYEIGGDIGTNEVLAFLESRIVHYPEAKAHAGQEG